MRKRIAVILSIFLILGLLFGCGTSSGAGEAGNEAAPGGNPTDGGTSSAAAPGDDGAEEEESGEGTNAGDIGAPGASGTERSRIVNIGTNGKATSLDPNNYRDYGSEATIRMCYETLIYTDHTGRGYDPMLAESWEIDPEGMFWTFHLRRDVFWHNGDPFNADDVAYTVQRCLDHRDEFNFTLQHLPSIDSVEIIDEYTVKIGFNQPTPLAGDGFRRFYIIPKNAHEEYGDDLFHLQYMIGTGPWKMEEWVDGQYTHYLKNGNYWNKNYDSYFEEVYLRFVGEPSSAIAAHLAGSVDAYINSAGISQDLLGLYAGTEEKTEIITMETNSTIWLGFSFKEDSIWNDENIRKAFDAAIDRQLILDNILIGGAVPVGYFHSSVIGHNPELGHPVYDPELAEQLLADSSYDGRPFSVMVSAGAQNEEVFLAIADMVSKVGFNMEVDIVDISVFTPRQQSGDYDVFAVNTSIPDGNPQRQMNRIPNNIDKSDYVNEAMNEPILKYNTEVDESMRREYAKEVNDMIFALKAPHVSLFHLALSQAIDYGIVGIDLYPDGMYNFAYVDYDPSKVK